MSYEFRLTSNMNHAPDEHPEPTPAPAAPKPANLKGISRALLHLLRAHPSPARILVTAPCHQALLETLIRERPLLVCGVGAEAYFLDFPIHPVPEGTFQGVAGVFGNA